MSTTQSPPSPLPTTLPARSPSPTSATQIHTRTHTTDSPQCGPQHYITVFVRTELAACVRVIHCSSAHTRGGSQWRTSALYNSFRPHKDFLFFLLVAACTVFFPLSCFLSFLSTPTVVFYQQRTQPFPAAHFALLISWRFCFCL